MHKLKNLCIKLYNFLFLLFIKPLLGREGIIMMAMLFATKLILGTITYDQVPRLLKEQVNEILIENGVEFLIPEEQVQ